MPDPPGGLLGIDDAIARSLSDGRPAGRRAGRSASSRRHRSRSGPAATHCASAGWPRSVTPPVARPCARAARHRSRTRRRGAADGPRHPDRPRTEEHDRHEQPARPSPATHRSVSPECVATHQVAVPHHEPPAVVRRRRIVVAIVLVIGACCSGSRWPTSGRHVFYWLTLALAAVWALGALRVGSAAPRYVRFSRPQPAPGHHRHHHRSCARRRVRGRRAGGPRDPAGARLHRPRCSSSPHTGSLLLVVFITLINGSPRRCSSAARCTPRSAGTIPAHFDGHLHRRDGVHAATRCSASPAIILGAVCAFERRATGGVLAPMLTHFVWGLIMVLALPPLFGV